MATGKWPQLLEPEHQLTLQSVSMYLLDILRTVSIPTDASSANDLHEHGPASRLELISCVCKVWKTAWKPAVHANATKPGPLLHAINMYLQGTGIYEIEVLALPRMYLK
ncbi:hypothetical protein V8C35DRAFT_38734 [Trichoderma chlorosporum]